MKDIFKFVRWQWNKFEFWQKCWIVSAFSVGAGVMQQGLLGKILIIVPVFVIFSFILKWFVWDGVVENWNKYKKEKTDLFDTIKTSDQK